MEAVERSWAGSKSGRDEVVKVGKCRKRPSVNTLDRCVGQQAEKLQIPTAVGLGCAEGCSSALGMVSLDLSSRYS